MLSGAELRQAVRDALAIDEAGISAGVGVRDMAVDAVGPVPWARLPVGPRSSRASPRANAAATVDKFHAVKIINDAVNPVRRIEQKQQSLLRGIRYIGLGDLASLWERPGARLDSLPMRHLKIATRNLKAMVYLLVGK